MQLFASLTHRSFAWLWTGQTISRLGDSLYRIALAWWVLEETGSATAMGAVLVFTSAPMVLFLLIGGVAVDRFSRTRLMLASDLGRGLVVSAVAVLAYLGRLEVWHIYIAGVIFGFVNAFFQPAFAAMLPEVAPPAALPSANSLTSLSERLTGVVGPALGAAIVAAGGTGAAFMLDGVSFFISAACLLPLLSLPVPSLEGQRNALGDLREGLATVMRLPWLWITIAIAGILNITVGSVNAVALPFLVDEHLHNDVRALGWIYSAISVGSIVAALALGQMRRILARGWVMYLALVAAGFSTVIMGLRVGLPGVLLAGLAGGLSITVVGLVWVNTLQEQVPRAQLGRVSSIDMFGSFVLLPVGYGLVGWLTDLAGPAEVFLLGGAITVLLALVGLAQPGIRALD